MAVNIAENFALLFTKNVPFPKKWTEKLEKKRNKNKPKMSKVD